jgi:hypothetical protein
MTPICMKVAMPYFPSAVDAFPYLFPLLVLEMGKVVPGPGPKYFFDRDRDEFFFLTGTGTGTKNDWSRSCLISTIIHMIGVRLTHKSFLFSSFYKY